VKAEELGRRSVLALISFVIQNILGFIGLLFLSWNFFADDYGMVHFAISFIGMISFIGDLGFGTAHLKLASEKNRDLGQAIGTYALFKIICTFLLVATVFFLLFIWQNLIGKGFETPEHSLAIKIVIFHFIFSNLSGIAILTFQARTHIAKMQLSALSGVMVQNIAIIYVALVTKNPLHYAYTFVLGSFVTFLIASLFLSKYPISFPSRKSMNDYLKFGIPLMFAGAIVYMASNIDKVMLQLFGSAIHVGYYTNAYKWAAIAVTLAAALSVVVLPHLSSLYSKQNIKGMAKFNIGVERYISLFCAPIMVYLMVMAYPFMSIITKDNFTPAYTILPIMAVYTYLVAISNPWSATITGSGHPELHLKISIFFIIIVFFLNALFIPDEIWGVKTFGLYAEGAAMATVLATIIQTMLFRYYSVKIIGIGWNPRISLHIWAAAGMGAVLYFLSLYFEITRIYHLALFGILGLGFYFGMLILMNEIQKSDFQLMVNVIHPKKMIVYINNELRGKKLKER